MKTIQDIDFSKYRIMGNAEDINCKMIISSAREGNRSFIIHGTDSYMLEIDLSDSQIKIEIEHIGFGVMKYVFGTDNENEFMDLCEEIDSLIDDDGTDKVWVQDN